MYLECIHAKLFLEVNKNAKILVYPELAKYFNASVTIITICTWLK